VCEEFDVCCKGNPPTPPMVPTSQGGRLVGCSLCVDFGCWGNCAHQHREVKESTLVVKSVSKNVRVQCVHCALVVDKLPLAVEL
jgi:hypothetical protein